MAAMSRRWIHKDILDDDNGSTLSSTKDDREVDYQTIYGPAEIETYHHTKLQQEVKDAKLQVWYPGRWQRNSSHALFRTKITLLDDDNRVVDEEDNDGKDIALLKFRSNARIISIEWISIDSDVDISSNKKKIYWKSSAIQQSDIESLYDHIILLASDGIIQPNNKLGGQSGYLVIELDTRPLHIEEDSLNAESKEIYPPPCITIQSSNLSQQQQLWEWKKDKDKEWVQVTSCWTTSNGDTDDIEEWQFPHQIDLHTESTVLPTNQLSTNNTEDELVYDFGKELLGKVYISIPESTLDINNDPIVMLRVGETLAEALNDEEEYFELCTDLTCTSKQPDNRSHMTWTSCHLLAFRYVRVIIPNSYHSNITVTCQVHSPLVTQRGSFSNNEIDNKIYNTAAYTLKMCIHNNFIVDGIKRDRLPWVGDLAVSLMANAYSFSDTEYIRWTLTILVRCGLDVILVDSSDSTFTPLDSHVNGIVDYSFWFIISHWLYHKYYDDDHFLRQEWKTIESRLQYLINKCSDKAKGWFIIKEEDSDRIFIDWNEDIDKSTAVQILWWYALRSGISLAEKMTELISDDDKKESMKEFISSLSGTQMKLENSYLEMEDIQHSFPRHSHILGVISGLYKRLDDRARGDEWWNPNSSDEHWKIICRCKDLFDQSRKVLLGDESPPVSTPYMKHLEILALAQLGERRTALQSVRSYWGGMLDCDATTFFEAFNENEDVSDIAQFYDRPFARSLCHAWSAGPCALYPEIILGLRPLTNGWKEWICDPLTCCISTVSATIDTKFGVVEVQIDTENLQVSVPNGTSMMLMNKRYSCGKHIFARKSLISSQDISTWSKKYRGWNHHPSYVIEPDVQIVGCEGIQMVDVPTVYQLPGDDGKFYMSFVGYDGEGYQSFVAESTDLLHWSNARLAMGYGEEGSFDYGGVVLGAYLFESYDINAPRVLKRLNGKFYSLYGAYASKGGYEIDPGSQGLASSEDGLVWKKESDESILSIYGPGLVKDWEKDSIYQPWLVEHDGIYYNFYNAKQMPQWVEQIGLATSTDLHNWVRHEDNPILRVGGGDSTDDTINDGYDTQFTADAKVFFDRDEDHWVMLYYGVGKGSAHIMVAYSKDLINWVRDPVPLYTAGSNPSGLNKQYAHKISLIWKDEMWYMFYCAVGGDAGRRGIGLITSQAPSY